jgi:hypothetical protein
MSPKVTEGSSRGEALTSCACDNELSPVEPTPLWPAGHLPLKKGD